MTDLIECIRYVRDGLAKLPEDTVPSRYSPQSKAAHERLACSIVRNLPKAKITDRWDGCKVSIAGIRASSTSGLHGALTNWIAAARRKLDGTGFIQTGGEKENVR